MSSILGLQTPVRGLRGRQPSRRHMAGGIDSRHSRDPPCRDTPVVACLVLQSHYWYALREAALYMPVHTTTAALQLHLQLGSRALQSTCCLSMRALTRTTLHEHVQIPSSLNMPVFALAAVQLCSVHAPYQPCEPCFGRHATMRPSHHPSTTRHVHDFTSTPTRDAPMLLTLTRSGCSTPCS
jgi:hypothetical protein